MKRKISFFIALVLVFALIAMPVNAAKPPKVELPPRVVDTVMPSVDPAQHKVADIWAANSIDVGDIFINASVVENSYEVRYLITEPDWFLTEVHFEAINDGDAAYIENKGTLIPGKFTAKAKYDLASEIVEYSCLYMSEAEVMEFAAHAVVSRTECDIDETIPFATSLAYMQGKTYSGGDVLPEHTYPESVGTYEIGRDWSNFISLGFQSDVEGEDTAWIIVEFDNPVQNKDGDDILVVEDTYAAYPIEKALVEASQDGSTWVELGITAPRVGTPDQTESYFDLGMLEWAKFIKVSERSVKSDFDGVYGDPNGFDLNAVISLQDNTTCTVVSESAWGKGADAGTANWAMTIPECAAADYYHWVLDQELRVEFFNAPATPAVSAPLESGESYKIEAVGTYRFANWGEAGIADARYSYRTPPYLPDSYLPSTEPKWVDGVDLGEKYPGYEYYLQVWMDGAFIEWAEEFNTDHIYTAEVDGVGVPVTFNIFDTSYGDNTGGIDINIYIWEVAW